VAPAGPRLRPASRVPRWLAAIRQLRRADAVFWIQMSARPAVSVWATAYTRPRAARACMAFDAWMPRLDRIGRSVSAQRMSACFVPFKESRDELSRRYPRARWEWLPWAVDAAAFDHPPQERDVFAFWMGRRHEPLHRALSGYARERGLAYEYTRPGAQLADYRDLARAIGRARYFVVTPPDLENPARTGPMSPFVMRYLEGLAAGSRLLGVMPNRDEYERLLPQGVLVETAADGSDLAERIEAAEADAALDARIGAARELVLREHDWEQRARLIHRTLSERQESEPELPM
jgi:Glycosyl transferases group 1